MDECIFEGLREGKVRQRIKITTPDGTELFALIASDRISAFERILEGEIQGKGSIITSISNYYFNQIRPKIPNIWAIDTENSLAGNTTLGYYAKPFEAEFIVRRYLTGSLLRKFEHGETIVWEDWAKLLGRVGRNNLYENFRFPEPIFTPTLKDDANNDPPVSEAELVERGILRDFDELREVKEFCLAVYHEVDMVARQRGLVLPDFKLELGRSPSTGNILLLDEISPDSVRLWLAADMNKKSRKAISKEFIRQDLIGLMREQNLIGENPSDEEIKKAAVQVWVDEAKYEEWSAKYRWFHSLCTGRDFDEDAYANKYAYEILEDYLERRWSNL